MSLDLKEIRSYKRWFLNHLVKQKFWVVAVLAGISIVTLLRVLIPAVLGYIVDNALITQDLSNLIFLLVILLVFYLVRNAMDYLTMMVGHYLFL